MAKCKRCGSFGFWVKLNEDGLCKNCEEITRVNKIQAEDSREKKAHAETERLTKLLAEVEDTLNIIPSLEEKCFKSADEISPEGIASASRIMHAEAQEELERQKMEVARIRKKYAMDGEIESAIKSLEQVILYEDPPLFNPNVLFLLELYKKAEQNDDAWELLSTRVMYSADYYRLFQMPIGKLRYEMAELLKDNNYYQEAVGMYMLDFYQNVLHYNKPFVVCEGLFRKDIEPCLLKLNWNDDIVNDLVAIVKYEYMRGDDPVMIETSIFDDYRAYIDRDETVRKMLSVDREFGEIRDEIDHQNKLANKAREEYARDGDVEKAILALEEALLAGEDAPILHTHTIFLINLYKKAGRKDAAGGLLTYSVLDSTKSLSKFETPFREALVEMAKRLESENSYSEAIGLYMLILYRDKLYSDESDIVCEKQFHKNIKLCLSKLNWSDDIVSDLVDIVEDHIGLDDDKAILFILAHYGGYLEENGLEM